MGACNTKPIIDRDVYLEGMNVKHKKIHNLEAQLIVETRQVEYPTENYGMLCIETDKQTLSIAIDLIQKDGNFTIICSSQLEER